MGPLMSSIQLSEVSHKLKQRKPGKGHEQSASLGHIPITPLTPHGSSSIQSRSSYSPKLLQTSSGKHIHAHLIWGAWMYLASLYKLIYKFSQGMVAPCPQNKKSSFCSKKSPPCCQVPSHWAQPNKLSAGFPLPLKSKVLKEGVQSPMIKKLRFEWMLAYLSAHTA